YKLAIEHKLAFPLHPEYRTLPMVWYVPPLSPIMNYFEGKDSIKNPDMIFPAIEEMRIPIQYLANMLTAGDTESVKHSLQRMARIGRASCRERVNISVDARPLRRENSVRVAPSGNQDSASKKMRSGGVLIKIYITKPRWTAA